MSRNPYTPAVHAVLEPLGFHKVSGVEWQRIVDGYLDDIQIQSLDGRVTVNVNVRDIVTKTIDRQAAPPSAGGLYYSASSRLGLLISKYDKWWPRDDPNGPSEVANAVEVYALPFLEGLHSIEAMTSRMRQRIEGRRWGNTNDRLSLAILLWRQARPWEACELMQNPPQRVPNSTKTHIEAVRRLVCEAPPPAAV